MISKGWGSVGEWREEGKGNGGLEGAMLLRKVGGAWVVEMYEEYLGCVLWHLHSTAL